MSNRVIELENIHKAKVVGADVEYNGKWGIFPRSITYRLQRENGEGKVIAFEITEYY